VRKSQVAVAATIVTVIVVLACVVFALVQNPA
jgi:hypothetical protein